MNIKRLWSDKSIEVVEIDGRWFAVYGWNGEMYYDCWETDENTFSLEDSKTYTIKPICTEVYEDEFEIVGYMLV